jgi:hypothetical protein
MGESPEVPFLVAWDWFKTLSGYLACSNTRFLEGAVW